MAEPLISIVTPTKLGREDTLLSRCIPSVTKLDWPNVEHIIVSDENPELRAEIDRRDLGVEFIEINDSWRDGRRDKSVGAIPWYIGSMIALGEFIGFLGDDDAVLPHHVKQHVTAMRAQRAMFSVSPVQFIVRDKPAFVIGDDTFEHGHLDSIGVMCHKTALRYANWTANGEDAADFRLVRDWRAQGLRGVFTGGEPTAHHHDGWAAQ